MYLDVIFLTILTSFMIGCNSNLIDGRCHMDTYAGSVVNYTDLIRHDYDCNPACSLPFCYCEKERIPGDIPTRKTPQMILFTYSGELTETVSDQLADVFSHKRKNPNGCPISITTFVSGQGTHWCSVNDLYYRGYEVAVQTNSTNLGQNWTDDKWAEQTEGYRVNVSRDARIPLSHIVGMRAPRHTPGGDAQFSSLYEGNFVYDSSLSDQPVNTDGLSYWPYTLDNPDTQTTCADVEKCPKGEYPGLWEIPSVKLSNENMSCIYLDMCLSYLSSAEEVAAFLKHNVRRRSMNRAPLVINLLKESLAQKKVISGISLFLDYVEECEFTWVISMSHLVSWMHSPVPAAETYDFYAWECPRRTFDRVCRYGNKTRLVVAPFEGILDIENVIIAEFVLMGVTLFFIWRYEKLTAP